jgi:hypothetical protein
VYGSIDIGEDRYERLVDRIQELLDDVKNKRDNHRIVIVYEQRGSDSQKSDWEGDVYTNIGEVGKLTRVMKAIKANINQILRQNNVMVTDDE